jgi:hypothetical protein
MVLTREITYMMVSILEIDVQFVGYTFYSNSIYNYVCV